MNGSASKRTAPSFAQCATCGLEYQWSLSHGMVDCVAQFRYEIARLTRERNEAEARAQSAETTLADVRKALAES